MTPQSVQYVLITIRELQEVQWFENTFF